MRFFTNLVPLRLELSESASLGDSYHVRRVRLNLMTLVQSLAGRLLYFITLLLFCALLFMSLPRTSYNENKSTQKVLP